MSFDVARVRGLYPTLGAGIAYLDGTFAALQPETVIRSIITTLRASPAQPGSRSVRSQRTSAAVFAARHAIADLVGATPDCVVLGGNLATLLQRFAGLLAREWLLGDEIVVSRLDHDSNIRPWVGVARSTGAVTRWAELDVETGELPEWQFERLINRRTRVVAVPLANAATGAIVDVSKIIEKAHEVGAIVVVNATDALPHMPIELGALGADLIGISTASFGGPTAGALVARPGLLYEIDPDLPGPVPQRYELGPLPVELVDGITAAIDHLAGLDESAVGTRRERLAASLAAVAVHEHRLFAILERRLRALPHVTLLGAPSQRIPAVAFTVARHTPDQVGEYLQRHRVSVWSGATDMAEFQRAIGADELGGAVHVGIMPHTTFGEVNQLVTALGEL